MPALTGAVLLGWKGVRRAIFVTEQLVRLAVMWKMLCFRIPIENRTRFKGDVGQQRGARASMTNFNIAIASGSAFDAVQEITRMRRGIGC